MEINGLLTDLRQFYDFCQYFKAYAHKTQNELNNRRNVMLATFDYIRNTKSVLCFMSMNVIRSLSYIMMVKSLTTTS